MLTAIRQWVIKTMLKSKGQTGVVQTLPKKELIEINTQITAQRLLQNGIDPNALRNSDQVENAIIAIESRPAVQEGIRSTSKAKVFDLQGKEIKNTKNIMGGEELPPPGSRGGPDDIAAPFASREETMTNMVKDELMKTDNPFSDLVKTTEKGPKTIKEREAEILAGMEKNNKEAVQRIKNRKLISEAIDNMSPTFVKGDRKYNAQMVAEDLAEKKFGKEFYDLDQKQQMDLYGEALEGYDEITRGMPDPEDFAQGGRAGFRSGSGKGIMEFFQNMIKPRKPKVFDEKRFREGPISLEFLENLQKKDLEKFIRSRDTMGPGGYGMYDNFADMPAGLRAAELIKTIKGPRNQINYKAAELFLGKKLKGNESADELIQMLNRQEMRADGGRIGLKAGMTKRAFLKLMGGVGATIGAAKTGLLGIGKGASKQVAKEVVEQGVRSTPPPYFFELANKIKMLGKPDKVTYADKVEIHRYRGKNGDEYELIEDLNTGDMRIQKDKTGVGSYGDKTFDTIEDRTVLEYRKGDVNVKDEGLETQSSFKEADEYEEYKVEFDADGTAADATDLDAVVQKEIIEEAGGEAPSIKKAGGGIARMLGE